VMAHVYVLRESKDSIIVHVELETADIRCL